MWPDHSSKREKATKCPVEVATIRHTELLVRRQQLWQVKHCKFIAGEHVTTQSKPLAFIVGMQKRWELKSVGQNTIKWQKCHGVTASAHREWHQSIENSWPIVGMVE